MQEKRAGVAAPQAGEPETRQAGLSETAPLLELVAAIANDEALAFSCSSVNLVEVRQGPLASAFVGHVDALGPHAERDGFVDVVERGMAQEISLSRLRGLERHDHGRTRHLDVPGRPSEPRPSEGLCPVAPLLPGRIHGERD